MAREEQLQGSARVLGSPGRSKLYGAVGPSPRQQLHRSGQSAKKPPEPLRRAVADCLSSSIPISHGSASSFSSEATRTLRDYISSPSTMDLAYHVLLEHANAERERSPAVISRCVVLLKRYLLRYIPKVETLRKIDHFCANSIVECDSSAVEGIKSAKSSTSGNLYSVPAPNLVSSSLIKSLIYVRSLVARHIPRLSFPQLVPSPASNAGNQSLETLSSLLSQSFNSNLSPKTVHDHEIPESEEVPPPSTSEIFNQAKIKAGVSGQYIYSDLLKWRWGGAQEQRSSSTVMPGESVLRNQDSRIHGFLEVGAAALLIQELETMSDRLSIPDVEGLFQPSSITMANDLSLSHHHLRAITASKRTRPGPQQFWVNVPVNSFSPRAHALFQYRYYSEQQPLRLNPAEISDVIAAVCSETSSPTTNIVTNTPRLNNLVERPYTDIAVSVLIKLVMDMYLMDSGIAAPLTITMLEDMLLSQRVLSRVRAFDIILNLGIHAHLLEPMFPDNPLYDGESEPSLGFQFRKENNLTLKRRDSKPKSDPHSSAIEGFESWLLVILFESLFLLFQMEENEEIVWASALSCLFYFICDRGEIQTSRLEGLDIRVIKTLLEVSRVHAWAQVIRSKLVCLFTNMFYRRSEVPTFLIEQVDLIGGIDFICLEYCHASTREERRNLFSVLLDYVLHQINDNCSYSFDDIQCLATMLAVAEAPEAFYIAIKHGVEGVGEILRRSIASALTRSPDLDPLNLLLEKISSKLDGIISSFTRLDSEFSYLIRVTKSFKSVASIDFGDPKSDASLQAKLSWANLHALLHSERPACRRNGYIWLVELLVSEISEGKGSIWLNIKNFQQQIGNFGVQESSSSSIPLSICIFNGLLNSRVNEIRRGFLFVLEKVLMRVKLLLDEKDFHRTSIIDECSYRDRSITLLDKANAVLDIMMSTLTLVFQKNETDRINILKMCDILFSQLCLRVLPSSTDKDHDGQTPQGVDFKNGPEKSQRSSDTSSIAALLLQGFAAVPTQLIARVPTSLFYWPLIQLAGAATDDIALGLAVGSKGRGNLAGSASDIRAALLLLLIGKCSSDPAAFLEVGGEEFFRELLDDTDSRVAYYSSAFLLKRMMMKEPEKYQRMLQSLIAKAQQCNNEKLLENPYLQLCGILQLSNDIGSLP